MFLLLQQHHVVLHVVSILRNDEIGTPSTSHQNQWFHPMVPSNLSFWSISREESLDSQQKYALNVRFLRALLCANDNFNPGYNRKKLIIKSTSILEEGCFTFEKLLHSLQCTACRRCRGNSIYKLVLPIVTGILSISDQRQCL